MAFPEHRSASAVQRCSTPSSTKLAITAVKLVAHSFTVSLVVCTSCSAAACRPVRSEPEGSPEYVAAVTRDTESFGIAPDQQPALLTWTCPRQAHLDHAGVLLGDAAFRALWSVASMDEDESIQSTNDDAQASKASCVQAGYFQDNFLQFFVKKRGVPAIAGLHYQLEQSSGSASHDASNRASGCTHTSSAQCELRYRLLDVHHDIRCICPIARARHLLLRDSTCSLARQWLCSLATCTGHARG